MEQSLLGTKRPLVSAPRMSAEGSLRSVALPANMAALLHCLDVRLAGGKRPDCAAYVTLRPGQLWFPGSMLREAADSAPAASHIEQPCCPGLDHVPGLQRAARAPRRSV